MMQLSIYEQTNSCQAAETELKDGAQVSNVTEIILSKDKAESVQMLLPMLTHLNQEQRWLAWIDPPMPVLRKWRERFGKDNMDKSIMVLRSDSDKNALNLTERALNAGTCHAVVTWTDRLSANDFEKLEVASKQGNSHSIVLRYR